ncbi:MAG: alpha/beta fold hydrolase [Bacteroidales bacterium]|nr:alpha/beta fold hydrolase [Bacteroidales bacterium]
MKIILKVLKWIAISVFVILVIGIIYIRFSRLTDKMIYQTGNNYEVFESSFKHKELYIPLEKDIKIHAVLFKPDSIKPIGTIFHHLGNGMTLINSQKLYKPLINNGFQIFAYERRGFAKSTGNDDNSIILKNDAITIFDKFLELKDVKNTKIIIWGQSLGGTFATMNAVERQSKIEGLILEGTFSSFPDMGKVYARLLNLENFKWLIPLLMNNDFPAEKEIKEINKPTIIIHSISDDQVPFELGKKLYDSSNKSNTEFWKIDGKHIDGMNKYEKEYVEKFMKLINDARIFFKDRTQTQWWRDYGTAGALKPSSDAGSMAVKNYREGTFPDIVNYDAETARKKIWKRNYACYTCQLSCKKSGVVSEGRFKGTIVHDSPEYETGTMLGANLLMTNINDVMKAIYDGDNNGLDIISLGNTIGFLIEAHEKKLIDKDFLDGINLKWNDIDSILAMIDKIAKREGIGELASKGVKTLSEKIGKGSDEFAMHVKGHELAAWNVHVNSGTGISYATANRGACHLNGKNAEGQNGNALKDSLAICFFATGWGGYDEQQLVDFVNAITGSNWTKDDFFETGERIFNLEKMMNYREGFTAEDDVLPERFFKEPLTVGEKKGAVLVRKEWEQKMKDYYTERGWDTKTSKPKDETLKKLKLGFLI